MVARVTSVPWFLLVTVPWKIKPPMLNRPTTAINTAIKVSINVTPLSFPGFLMASFSVFALGQQRTGYRFTQALLTGSQFQTLTAPPIDTVTASTRLFWLRM